MIDETQFKNALACFATGVTVVTNAGDGRGPVGVTVNAFSSVSLAPPLILVCLDNRTGTIEQFLAQDAAFAINVLAHDQGPVSNDFAGPQTYDLHGHPFTQGHTGAPLLDGTVAALECHVHAVHDGGDHRIVVGRVASARADAEKAPLVYFQRSYHALSGQS